MSQVLHAARGPGEGTAWKGTGGVPKCVPRLRGGRSPSWGAVGMEEGWRRGVVVRHAAVRAARCKISTSGVSPCPFFFSWRDTNK